MPTLLKNLKIHTIGSVDYPANPQATVTLMKRGEPIGGDDKGGTQVNINGPRVQIDTSVLGTFLQKMYEHFGLRKEDVDNMKTGEGLKVADEVRKSLPQEVQDYIKDLEDKVSKMKELEEKAAKVDELEKRLEELSKKADANDKKDDQEDIFKSLPEPVKKYIHEIEKKAKEAEEIAKREREERITREFVAKAAELRSLPVDAEKFGPILKSIHEALPDVYAEVEAVLKAANELVEKSKLFDEIGKGSGAEGSVWSKIESLANELVSKSAGMTKEKAIAEVLKSNPQLYEEYQKELKGM